MNESGAGRCGRIEVMAAVLEVEGLSTHIALRDRTVYAVDGLSFTIGPGETVGMVGESGSGKSMTGSSIIRLLPEGGTIVAGTIVLNGRDITKVPESEMRRLRGSEIGLI